MDPNKSIVCIREIQKSLKFSAKKLIESKIRSMNANHLFDITQTEIRRLGGEGIIIFQGMQDHTADSIKSLEGFDTAWVEEAQSLSKNSLKLLRPTIREEGSEIWFSWNPDQPEDPVDDLFRGEKGAPDDSVVVKVNYYDNPFFPEVLLREMESDRKRMDPETFAHVWEGEYNVKSEAVIFSGKYIIDEFEPQEYWGGPYHGLDFGFANDPTAATRVWVADNRLYIEYEAGSTKLELDKTGRYMMDRIPGIEKYVIRADNARPESISYLKRQVGGLNRIQPVSKWPGSVEDGIAFMKSFEKIIIHPRCKAAVQEFRLYQYKIDKHSGDVLPVIVDANNHYIDSIRYGIDPLIKKRKQSRRPASASYTTY